MKHATILVPVLATLGLGFAAGCTQDPGSDPPPSSTPPAGATSGDQGTTFDHENDGISPWDLIDRIEKEGPPKYTSHVHSCPKVRVKTLGNVLTSLGVDVNNQTMLSAGDLYRNGGNALGQANFANRIRENIGVTTSGASREFDVFAAAADEIIANVPTLERCKDAAGTPAQLFDENNACQPSGITCLIGVPAQLGHLDACNFAVQGASDTSNNYALGKRIAVASLLAAAYTCE
jgi:hypothetical protein